MKAIYVQYGILRRLHPRWQPSELKSLTPRERNYWIDYGNYMFERKLSAYEAGKELMEAP